MTEPKKGTSLVSPKEKSSLLVEVDDGIGKEFLSSWKSMSMTEDNTLDFGFETVPKGKKKTFNFENFDMDFNLDGDFGKLSSFKVDMPDLDFSSPSPRKAKPRERPEEESSRNYQEKENRFTFFDFNESDDFSFDSSIAMKGEKASNKNLGDKGVASDKNDDKGFKQILCCEAGDRMITKPAASEGMACSEIEMVVGGTATLASSSPEKRMIPLSEETNEQSPLKEKAAYRQPCAPEGRNKFPIRSICEKESNQVAISDMHTDLSSFTEGSSQGVVGQNVDSNMTAMGSNHENQQPENSSVVGQNVDSNMTAMGSNHENQQPKNSSLLFLAGSEKIMFDQKNSDNNTMTELMDETISTHDDVDPEDISTEAVSRKALHDSSANQDIQILTSNHPLVALGSEPEHKNLTPTEESEIGAIRLRCLKGTEETRPLFLHSSSSQPEFSSLGGNDSSHLCHANEQRSIDSQLGSKLVGGNSDPLSKELTKSDPVFLGAKKITTNFSNTRNRVGFSADGIRNGSKLADYSRLQDKEASKGKALTLGSKKDAGSQPNTSSPYEKTTKFAVSGMDSVGKHKVSSVKSGKRMADLSSLKNLRIQGGNNVSSSLTPHQDINSSGKLEENMELQGNTFSKISYSVCRTKTQTPSTPSLKRKNIKESNADLASLKLLKRFSGPRSETRNVGEPSNVGESSEIIVEEKDFCKEIKTKNYQSTSTLEAAQELSLTKLEMPLVLENNCNLEQAETYSKELEDIRNMLKKKHEEAREILLRAIVNSNNLLMLNHPIYDQKISKLQKFAAELLSKELPMKSLGSTAV